MKKNKIKIKVSKKIKKAFEQELLEFETEFKERKDTFYPWINGYVSGVQWVLAHMDSD
jgi:hypothetical protein